MTEIMRNSRRRLFQLGGVGLVSPLLLPAAGVAFPGFRNQPTASACSFEVKQYKLGSFKITIISDGATVQETP